MCIRDSSDNDLQMTQAAGISVCMGNGSERLKQLCDRIAPTVYEDGLASCLLYTSRWSLWPT